MIGAKVVSAYFAIRVDDPECSLARKHQHCQACAVLLCCSKPRRAEEPECRPSGSKKADGRWATGSRPIKTFRWTSNSKLLESDPRFKKLPADRQNALRERLKKFNSLPPEKRQQAFQRMEFLAKLTPQQRQQLRDANTQLQGLPPDRQVAVHKAVRHLRQMPAPERQQVIQSDRFKALSQTRNRSSSASLLI